MAMHTCKNPDCGVTFEKTTVGRPPNFCDTCREAGKKGIGSARNPRNSEDRELSFRAERETTTSPALGTKKPRKERGELSFRGL